MVRSTTGALTTTYRYNGLSQRVSKTGPGSSAVSRRFVYDEAGHLIGEYDGAGAPIQETVYLGDLPIAVLSGTDGIHYVHADQINTPRLITDSQGVVVWRWEADPFGVGVPDQDPDGDGLSFVYHLRMPGQYFDAENGLYYNYFRDYDPSLGRHVQSDPIGLAGGLNTYLYGNANPLRYSDPTGESATTLTWPIAAGSAAADGPLPIGDAIGAVLLGGALIYDMCADDDDGDACLNNWGKEIERCEQWRGRGQKDDPNRWYRACKARAGDRLSLCRGNGGTMPADAPGEWSPADITGD